MNFIRSFIHTYLNIDGTSFTDRAGYDTLLFKDEVKNRDRLYRFKNRVGCFWMAIFR